MENKKTVCSEIDKILAETPVVDNKPKPITLETYVPKCLKFKKKKSENSDKVKPSRLKTYKPVCSETDKILEESPVVEAPKSTTLKLKTFKPKGFNLNRFKFNKKTIFIGLGVIILMVLLYNVFSTGPCIPQECSCDLAQDYALDEFVKKIKGSIVQYGYTEINIDGKVLKLAPYTG